MHTIGNMIERKISPASLENLKLGAIARRKGKVRVTLTLLPTTIKWLKKHDANGNMSECVDEVVRRIVAGELVKKSD
jgi:hypothetical protein